MKQNRHIDIHLAHTQGFCAGVSVALDIVDLALQHYGLPLYVRHAIVHNDYLVNHYTQLGVQFVENLDEIPIGSRVILSAHGSAPEVYAEARARQLDVLDATCPLVRKVHMEAKKMARRRMQIILIGHRGHQEFVGTKGYIPESLCHVVETDADIDALNLDPNQPIGVLTQTTLSVSDTRRLIDKIKHRYPTLSLPPEKDICYATQNRQDAILDLVKTCDVILVCGSKNSSNTTRLYELAKEQGRPAYMLESAQEFTDVMIADAAHVGISSGASVPQILVTQLVNRIQKSVASSTCHQAPSTEADVWFPLPKPLRDLTDASRPHGH
jgi:4-hydroxy-3-methylbut-2-enyl diphosphate reductase